MHLLIQYKIKEDRVDEQKAAIREFVTSIAQMNDSEIQYSAYQMPDNVSFKHLAIIDSDDAKARLQSQEFFKKFSSEIEDRCTEGPTVAPLLQIATA